MICWPQPFHRACITVMHAWLPVHKGRETKLKRILLIIKIPFVIIEIKQLSPENCGCYFWYTCLDCGAYHGFRSWCSGGTKKKNQSVFWVGKSESIRLQGLKLNNFTSSEICLQNQNQNERTSQVQIQFNMRLFVFGQLRHVREDWSHLSVGVLSLLHYSTEL